MSLAEHSKVIYSRKLGAGENLWWQMGLTNPVHFCYVACLKGNVSTQRLQQAIHQIQHKYPILRSVVKDQKPIPTLDVYDRVNVAFEVVKRTSATDFEHIVHEQMTMPFEDREKPLWRILLIQGDDASELLLVIHHALFDGMAASQVTNDLLSAYEVESRDMPKEQPQIQAYDRLLSKANLIAQVWYGAGQIFWHAQAKASGRAEA